MREQRLACLVCQRDDQRVPLIHLSYQGNPLWICPEHMPVLIHNTEKLMAMLEESSREDD